MIDANSNENFVGLDEGVDSAVGWSCTRAILFSTRIVGLASANRIQLNRISDDNEISMSTTVYFKYIYLPYEHHYDNSLCIVHGYCAYKRSFRLTEPEDYYASLRSSSIRSSAFWPRTLMGNNCRILKNNEGFEIENWMGNENGCTG